MKTISNILILSMGLASSAWSSNLPELESFFNEIQVKAGNVTQTELLSEEIMNSCNYTTYSQNPQEACLMMTIISNVSDCFFSLESDINNWKRENGYKNFPDSNSDDELFKSYSQEDLMFVVNNIKKKRIILDNLQYAPFEGNDISYALKSAESLFKDFLLLGQRVSELPTR